MTARLDRMTHAVDVACRLLPEGLDISVRDNGTIHVHQPIAGDDYDMDALARDLAARPVGDWSISSSGYASRTLVAVVEGVTIRLPERRRVVVGAA